MKRCLLPFFLLIADTSSAQSIWPYNQKTGYIEFKGTLPWPARAKTPIERETLVQHWYQTTLRDSIQVTSASQHELSHLLRKNGSVTARGHLKHQRQPRFYQLNYSLSTAPTAKGLVYKLWDFSYAGGEDDVSVLFDLESAVKDNRADSAVLSLFRRRIIGAIGAW